MARNGVAGLAGGVELLAVLVELVVVELHRAEARNERVEHFHLREGAYSAASRKSSDTGAAGHTVVGEPACVGGREG